ncbi:class I SAM-dependent methyltransferase [Nocardioides sp. STR2]|uniref:Class I SAM-dependent methyltransferase n=1 Tax=Nocardioides pini TaxID=2975053 RepID=A0ABT4C6U5_9ACTN|nr:class I SAM-dependent methyltransferase [Nocardioides pini]
MDQANAWDGDEGELWAARHEQLDAVLGHYQAAFEGASDIRRGDRVLDIGCGTGATTRAAARAAGEGSAFGVDLSSSMIDVARGLAAREGLTRATFARADAQVHPFVPKEHDAVISRTGAMFFGQPEEAFANIARSMRSGGRLTLLTWQPPAANPWFGAFASALLGVVPAPPRGAAGPFSMSDPDDVNGLLGTTGFSRIEITGLTGPTTYGRSIDEAQELLTGLLAWMLQKRPPADRPRALQALRDTLAAHAGPDGVQFDSATWLVAARRD